MRLEAHRIVDLRVTRYFLQSMTPRPSLCCLHQTGTQSVTTALRIHVPPFNIGDWRCYASFSVVPETHLDTPAESFPSAFQHEGDATLWGSKIGIDVVGMLLCCAAPQG